MISDLLKGVLTASVTPVNRDHSLDLHSMGNLIDYYAASGIHGVLVPSSTGEAFALPAAERAALVTTAAKKSSGRLSIFCFSA